jgi:uncharacterized phiE125 gp8 family phage protein
MAKYEPVPVDAPSSLPVSVAECKRHLRIYHSDEDDIIELYLNAAISHLDGAQGWLGRSIVAQTWSQQFDHFECTLRLDVAPVSEITALSYIDSQGVEQTVADSDYALINGGSAPEIRFHQTFAHPAVSQERPAVTATFLSGYGEDAEVPAAIKVGILLMVGDMYQEREAKVSGSLIENSAVSRLLNPYRTRWAA